MDTIFVDTSAFVALKNVRDPNRSLTSKNVSFIDCTSFALIWDQHIKVVFGFNTAVKLRRAH